MATYKILYWQEIPSQIRAEDEQDDVTVPMPERFMARIDHVAMHTGMAGTDQYLDQWHWSEEEERPGSAQDVAEAVAAELAARAGW
jgi:Virulence factor